MIALEAKDKGNLGRPPVTGTTKKKMQIKKRAHKMIISKQCNATFFFDQIKAIQRVLYTMEMGGMFFKAEEHTHVNNVALHHGKNSFRCE